MLLHHEAVLRQCSNPSMTAMLQDLVRDVREIFRGDSKRLKGPEAFSLMLMQLELLETQLHDEEATQSRRAVKFNFAAEAGGGGAPMVAAAQASQKPCSKPMLLCSGVPLPQGSAR